MKKANKKARRPSQREPSRASLREMPELDLTKQKPRPNPYAARIAAEGFSIQVDPGRPKRGSGTGSEPRSIRFPPKVWKALEARAKAEGVPLHAVLRAAVIAWLNQQPVPR